MTGSTLRIVAASLSRVETNEKDRKSGDDLDQLHGGIWDFLEWVSRGTWRAGWFLKRGAGVALI